MEYVETTGSSASPAATYFSTTNLNPSQYEFFVVNDIAYSGFTQDVNIFGSGYVVGPEMYLVSNLADDDEMDNQDLVALRLNTTLDTLSRIGRNYMYICGVTSNLWEDLLPDSEQGGPPFVNIFGAFSYNLSAPVFEEVQSATFGGYEVLTTKCEYDGAEISTYDEKFGAINSSASADNIISDYINSIAQDVVVSDLLFWFNNKTVNIGNIQTPAANLTAGAPIRSATLMVTGSASTTMTSVGGSTAPAATGGGGGGGY